MFRPRFQYQYSYRQPRHVCLNEGVLVTALFFVISVVSFLLLLFFTGFLWASIFLFSSVILAAFYIDWLRRVPARRPFLEETVPTEFVPVEVGLDASAIAALPSFKYRRYCDRSSDDESDSNGSNGWMQCAICIGLVPIEVMVRSVPVCDHLFHVECIDMWLKSHSTCPLCRATVAQNDETSNLDAEV